MIFQITETFKRLVALIALMPDVLVGDLLVLFEAGLTPECFPALAADVRTRRGVGQFVFFQIAARGAGSSTRLAAVNVLQDVHPFVPL